MRMDIPIEQQQVLDKADDYEKDCVKFFRYLGRAGAVRSKTEVMKKGRRRTAPLHLLQRKGG
jgi:hypothetical protein